MKKKNKIKFINEVIETWGSVGTGDIEADCSPCASSIGPLISLVESFDVGFGNVVTYDTSSHSCDGINDFEMPYEDMSKKTISHIYELMVQYNSDERKNLTNIDTDVKM